MKFSITLLFDVPEGTAFKVDTARLGNGAEYVPPFADELIPLPDQAIPIPGDVNLQPGYAEGAAIAQPTPFRGAATNQVSPTLCPVHRTPWKLVPAGVSKKTGKSYSAFYACSERGCDQRPAA